MVEIKFVLLVCLIVISTNIVSASGVVTPYWSGNPLKLAPGESTTIQLTLQNMVGDEDINFGATVSGVGATILDDPTYLVPSGTEVPMNMMITVPKNAKIGEIYEISASFKEVSTGEGGMLRVAGAVTIRFPVEVVSETESSLYGKKTKTEINFLWIIVVLILLLIIFLAIRKKNQRKR